MSYELSPHVARMVRDRMAAGHYESEDELLADALMALDDFQERYAELRVEIQQRTRKAGTPFSQPLNWAEFKAEARRRWANKRKS